MDPSNWAADRVLTSGLVAELLGEQFPELGEARLRFFGAGWDSEVYELGDVWVLRFPKRKEVVERLQREIAVLPVLAEALPLPIPRFEIVGRPSARFPYPFVGYRKLPGVPIIDQLTAELTAEEEASAARALGEFLTALHGFPLRELPIELPRAGPGKGELPPDDLLRRLEHLNVLAPELSRLVTAYYASFSVAAGPERRVAPAHCDLDVEHLLVSESPRRLSGVIDWGDFELTAAAVDFVGAYAWRGRRFVKQVLSHYEGPAGGDDLDWMRARLVRVGLNNVAYGRMANRPEYTVSGLHALRNALA
jgi:aminoglycoside phosphotransferase (APT) family kinase protein